MNLQRWRILFAAALVTMAETGRGQNAAHWSGYKMADGLAEAVFNTVSFTPQGRLIATSPNAPLASALDGYSVTNFPAPPQNLGRITESPGGQRWAVVPQGLVEYHNASWQLQPVAEISARFRAPAPNPGPAPQFLPTRQDCGLILLPDQLLEFNAGNPEETRTVSLRRAAETRLGIFTGMAVARDGGLWLSGAHGVAKVPGPLRNLQTNSVWQVFAPPASLPPGQLSQPVPDQNGGLTLIAGAAESGPEAVVEFDGNRWTVIPAGGRDFFRAWTGPDQTLWAATRDSLFAWEAAQTNWVENTEVSAGQIFDVAWEPDGAFWLATADGLFRCALPLWSRPEAVSDLDLPVSALARGGPDRVYFIAGRELHIIQDEVVRVYPLPPAFQMGPAARLFPLNDGVVIGSGEKAVKFQLKSGSANWEPIVRPTPSARPLGLRSDGGVVFSGVNSNPFGEYNGSTFSPLAARSGFRGDERSLTTWFAAQSGDDWLGGGREIWRWHDGLWQEFSSPDATTPENAVAFTELPGGQIWCATLNELWEFDGTGWIRLQTRFNHINALLTSRTGDVWLASNGGLFRFHGGVWLENGSTEGLPNGPVPALAEDQRGRIWAATPHGLMVFHPEANPAPPRTYIRRLDGDAHRLSAGDAVNLQLSGQAKWKYSRRDELLYSYQLDQRGWSPFREETSVTWPDPAAGRHYFQARSMDRNGNVDVSPATLDFTVATPWFRDVRLWVALSLGGSVALFFGAVAWQRHRALVRSHAAVEQKIAERTRELEMATRELLHSQKMNALGTLAAGIAHDFNNILSIIKGSAQIIEDNLGQPEKVRTRINRIKTVVQQGAEIVDAMLGFGRQAEVPTAPCNLNAVVAETLKLLGDRFQREVEIRFEHAEDLPDLPLPREFIQQILLNFIFNAADAMSDRKKITLATARVDTLPPEVMLNPPAAPSFVLLSVRDQGSGIAPGIKTRIFEPFFTTKALSARRGTGLGLSMVYELAKKMGAGLAVHSVVGEGSLFTLILPAPAGRSAQPPAETLPETFAK